MQPDIKIDHKNGLDEVQAISAPAKELTLEKATTVTLMAFLNQVSKKAADTIEPYQNHQEMVILHNNLHKAINAATEAAGHLDCKKLDKAIEDLTAEIQSKHDQKKAELELQGNQANNTLLENHSLKLAEKMKALNSVKQQIAEVRKNAKSLTKDQKDELRATLDFSIKEHNMMMERLQHVLTKTSNEHNQAFQYAMNILKTLHQISTRFLQGITGR